MIMKISAHVLLDMMGIFQKRSLTFAVAILIKQEAF